MAEICCRQCHRLVHPKSEHACDMLLTSWLICIAVNLGENSPPYIFCFIFCLFWPAGLFALRSTWVKILLHIFSVLYFLCFDQLAYLHCGQLEWKILLHIVSEQSISNSWWTWLKFVVDSATDSYIQKVKILVTKNTDGNIWETKRDLHTWYLSFFYTHTFWVLEILHSESA